MSLNYQDERQVLGPCGWTYKVEGLCGGLYTIIHLLGLIQAYWGS